MLLVSCHDQRFDCLTHCLKCLSSRLVGHQSQEMMVAASATADRKTFGHMS